MERVLTDVSRQLSAATQLCLFACMTRQLYRNGANVTLRAREWLTSALLLDCLHNLSPRRYTDGPS